MKQNTENKTSCSNNCCCSQAPFICKKIKKLWSNLEKTLFYSSVKTFCYSSIKTLFDSYYTLKVFGLSIILGGLIYYISSLNRHESRLSVVDRHCLNSYESHCANMRMVLSGKQILNKEIKNQKMTRCVCRDTAFLHSQIQDSDFRGSDFYRSYFDGVLFMDSDFFKSFFYGAIFKNVIFQNSELGGVVFNFADFKNTEFRNVNLQSSVFIGARFQNSYYDSNTKLPFSQESARKRGLLPLSEKNN